MNGMTGVGADIGGIGGIGGGDSSVTFPTLIFPFSTARIG